MFRELNDSTAFQIWVDSFKEIGETVSIGKNAISDDYSMAVAFFQAGKELEKKIQNDLGYSLYRLEYPMLFLYRHSLELFLKCNIPKKIKSHNLDKLLAAFILHLKETYDVDISKGWFANTIREFSQIDPLGQSFRYSKNINDDEAIPTDHILNYKEWSIALSNISFIFLYLHMTKGNIHSAKRFG